MWKSIAVVAAQVFFVLALPVFLVSFNVWLEVGSLRLYEYGFRKYEVASTSGLSPTELQEGGKALRDYLNSDQELANPNFFNGGQPRPLFNEREVSHLKDVKGLLQTVFWFQGVSFLYLLGFLGVGFLLLRREFVPVLGRALFGGGVLAGVAIVAVGLMGLLSFDRLFYSFHIVSFTNDLWRLDPREDYLIMMFPQGFWRDATLLLGVATIVEATFLGAVGWGLGRLKLNSPRKSSNSKPSKRSRTPSRRSR